MREYLFAVFLFNYEFVLEQDQVSPMGFEAEELRELTAESVKDVFFDWGRFIGKEIISVLSVSSGKE